MAHSPNNILLASIMDFTVKIWRASNVLVHGVGGIKPGLPFPHVVGGTECQALVYCTVEVIEYPL